MFDFYIGCIGEPTLDLIANPSIDYSDEGDSRSLRLIHGCGVDTFADDAIKSLFLLVLFVNVLLFLQ